ncbi:MAG: glutamine amidotransferase [Chloroflexi bacterium]|nr:glutamine amidotransferase [Chloroflexota bacterium]
MRIGVLALQGAFREHIQALVRLGADAVEVRRPRDLDGLDGLIIPGGESTTIRLLMAEYGLDDAIRERIGSGFPVVGTCAGMIVLAKHVDDEASPGLNGLDVQVHRNAFGRQVDSFEEDIAIPALGDTLFHGVFIRAPIVESVGPGVEVLAKLPDGRIVAVRQGSVIGVSFHPELTDDDRFHRLFLSLIAARETTASTTPVCSSPTAVGEVR